MKLNKRQKALLCVCGAAAAWLGYDRVATWRNLGPAVSLASPLNDGSDGDDWQMQDLVGASPPRPTLADRLQQANSPQDVAPDRDAFMTPAAWVEPAPAGGEASPASPEPPVLTAPEQQFQQRHRLQAVLCGTDGFMVLIDGTLVGLGQTVDGWQITSVDRHMVSLTRQGRTAVLRLAESPGDLSPAP